MEQPGANTQTVTWIMIVALAPVFYVLSVPPMAGMFGAPLKSPPAWFTSYVRPADWLYEHCPAPLQKGMRSYAEW
jgi:hypothetical protein